MNSSEAILQELFTSIKGEDSQVEAETEMEEGEVRKKRKKERSSSLKLRSAKRGKKEERKVKKSRKEKKRRKKGGEDEKINLETEREEERNRTEKRLEVWTPGDDISLSRSRSQPHHHYPEDSSSLRRNQKTTTSPRPRHSHRSKRVERDSHHYELNSSRHQHRRESQEERPPVRHKDEDVFWDSTWDALQLLQKKAEDQERKGRHYLDDRRRTRESTTCLKNKDYHRRSKIDRKQSQSPECEELKRLKRLKEIQELVVKEDEKYVDEPPDPNLFEWDNVTKNSIEKQFKDKSRVSILDLKNRPDEKVRKKALDSSQMTLDEIEAIKDIAPIDEKEEGELRSEDEDNEHIHRKNKKETRNSDHKSRKRRKSRSPSRSRHCIRRSSSRNKYSRHTQRSRHRYRSRSKLHGLQLTRKKLLAIAKKNAVKLLSSNNLMGMDHNRLVAIKSGGQSLNQLTQFCRELAKKESLHHPFVVKERPIPNPISFGTTSSTSNEHLTPAAKMAAKSHRMLEFPVSSGNAHRVKESFTESDKDKKSEPKSPTSESEPVKDMITQPEESSNLSIPEIFDTIDSNSNEEHNLDTSPKNDELLEEQDSNCKQEDLVFDDVEGPTMDIGSIVSQRLNAMRKLTENPNDQDALKEMCNVQKEMSNWAQSKKQTWSIHGTYRSQGIVQRRCLGGFGEFMLRKMGWNQGEGLGKDRSGDVDPLTLDIKMDKKGLMSVEEGLYKRKKGSVLTMTACKDLSYGGPPNFVQAFECGPPHKKQYIYKVTVNGMEYQPTVACENKKKAKSDAATFALQEMGLLPKDPNNPL
ncbi:SON [Lepeophtheirus salmonis]|uniref:SON n=1 Tax=Lepeophtheirus salmonis TaxID=72036 RepID=A0A7R8HB84_LEPSM|nr:SON [Lepeophtheirus salmonis]CAF2969763.1 SON [Lepeophtheirus salmonis]